MKTIIHTLNALALLALSTFFIACAMEEEDGRAYQAAQIAGVKIDGSIYLPTYSNNVATVMLPAGKDLSNVQVELLVTNGEPLDFTNNEFYDVRKPIALTIAGKDGTTIATTLRVLSPPKLITLSIAGLDVPAGDIYPSEKNIIVQVPEDTKLDVLAVNMEFSNGTLQDFENGVTKNYTQPVPFSVLGVDGETIYPYELVITTDPVGPASVKSIVINGVETTRLDVAPDGITLVPYVPSLSDFTNATISLNVGYGNTIDPSFNGNGLNLIGATHKVKVTGTNGQTKEFIISTPQLDAQIVFSKAYASLGVGANDLGAVGFSGNYVLSGSYTVGTKAPAYYDYSGTKAGQLSTKGCVNISYGFRKFAIDQDGIIVGSSLGMSQGEQWVYKWNNVTEDPTPYISFSKAALGVSYSPRAAGLNVLGSLNQNAIITMAMAQQTDVIIWKVSGGQVGTPEKFVSPVKFGYYASIQPLPDDKGYLLTTAATQLNGIIVLDNHFQEQFRITGMPMTDLDIIKHNNHVYMAYVVMVGGNTPTMRICDITDGTRQSYSTPIMNMPMKDQAANANVTTDAAFKVINGKLHAAFVSSNANFYLFKLEQ